jgi:hypothetical protein
MRFNKTTCLVFVIVVTITTLSVTVFRPGKGSPATQQNMRRTSLPIYEKEDRYPVVDSDEPEPADAAKKAQLKKQRQRYDKDPPFRHPGPNDTEVAFLPEAQFDFPALPVSKSDVIVIAQVLSAEPHRSENKLNVFSNFEVRVDEVLKGNNLSAGRIITVQRIGGFVKYPDGRKVLFRLMGNGMPAVGGRYAFFLKTLDEDYSIITGYELGTEGVMPLDDSRQFERYQGENETDFVRALRDAISRPVPQMTPG